MNRGLPRLRPGDVVSVVAPAGPVDHERLQEGIRVLEAWGLRPRVGRHVGTGNGYLAGSDGERASDLTAAFADPESRAVLYARGGYGTTRLLPELPLATFACSGQLLAGYSDLTALALALSVEAPFPHLYGPHVVELATATRAADTESYRAALFGEPAARQREVGGLTQMQPGQADGILLGGCLSLLVALTGTPYLPTFRDRILFLEEVNEEPYRLDRMLTHLRSAGVLDGVAGLVIGQLTGCATEASAPGEPTALDVVASFATAIDGPVLAGLPVGHGADRLTVPLGVRVQLDAGAATLTFITG